MRRQQIEVQASSSASPPAVFAIVADGGRWPGVTPIGSFALEDPGRPEEVGATRVFSTGPLTMHERIVALTAPSHFAYELVSGLPIRDYRADINLEPEGTGTRLRWRASFEPKLAGTGWIFRLSLTRVLRQSATGICRGAEST